MGPFERKRESERSEQELSLQSASSYKIYCKSESDEAYVTLNKNQEEYDKQLLTVSTGLLAVLIAFLKDLIHLPNASCRLLLYLCFSLLAGTITTVLFSFQFSSYVLERVRSHWKKEYEEEGSSKFPEGLTRCVVWVNRGAGLCFALGVLLGVTFIVVNLSMEANMPDKITREGVQTDSQQERGAVPKLPQAPRILPKKEVKK